MKNLLVIIFILCSSIFVFCQKNDTVYNSFQAHNSNQTYSKNSVGVDVAYFYMGERISSTLLNYERTLIKHVNLRIGMGFITTRFSNGFSHVQIPLSINFITGNKNNHFECDLGERIIFNKNVFFLYTYPNEYILSPIVNLGYRYQKPDGGIFCKALVGFDGLSLGVGYAF